jgi:transposase-like protein
MVDVLSESSFGIMTLPHKGSCPQKCSFYGTEKLRKNDRIASVPRYPCRGCGCSYNNKVRQDSQYAGKEFYKERFRAAISLVSYYFRKQE